MINIPGKAIITKVGTVQQVDGKIFVDGFDMDGREEGTISLSGLWCGSQAMIGGWTVEELAFLEAMHSGAQ